MTKKTLLVPRSCQQDAVQRFQIGGPVMTTSYSILDPINLWKESWDDDRFEKYYQLSPVDVGMIKAKIALNDAFGNKTAQRIVNRDPRLYAFHEHIAPKDPETGKVIGSVYGRVDGNVVSPAIKDVNGQLAYVEDFYALPDQNIYFNSPRDAEIFNQNYWQYAPMRHLEDGPMMYNRDVQEVSPYYLSPKNWIKNWYSKRSNDLYSKHQQSYASDLQRTDEEYIGEDINPYISTDDQLQNVSKLRSYIISDEEMKKQVGKEDILGAATVNSDEIYYVPMGFQNYYTQLHEYIHKMAGGDAYTPQEWAIGDLMERNEGGMFNENVTPDFEYWDAPHEIYARLMQFRSDNKLDPEKIYTIEDIQNLRQQSFDYDLLSRYSDNFMYELLNDIY